MPHHHYELICQWRLALPGSTGLFTGIGETDHVSVKQLVFYSCDTTVCVCVCVSLSLVLCYITVCTSCKEEQLKPIALSLNNKSNLCVCVCVCHYRHYEFSHGRTALPNVLSLNFFFKSDIK